MAELGIAEPERAGAIAAAEGDLLGGGEGRQGDYPGAGVDLLLDVHIVGGEIDRAVASDNPRVAIDQPDGQVLDPVDDG